MLSDSDLALLPTIIDETVISKFLGGTEYVPCGPVNPLFYLQQLTNTSKSVHTVCIGVDSL